MHFIQLVCALCGPHSDLDTGVHRNAKYGYTGPPFCRRCAEVFRAHQLLIRNPPRCGCRRDTPCLHCTKILAQFVLPPSELHRLFDAGRAKRAALQTKRPDCDADPPASYTTASVAPTSSRAEFTHAGPVDHPPPQHSGDIMMWNSRKRKYLSAGCALLVTLTAYIVTTDFMVHNQYGAFDSDDDETFWYQKSLNSSLDDTRRGFTTTAGWSTSSDECRDDMTACVGDSECLSLIAASDANNTKLERCRSNSLCSTFWICSVISDDDYDEPCRGELAECIMDADCWVVVEPAFEPGGSDHSVSEIKCDADALCESLMTCMNDDDGMVELVVMVLAAFFPVAVLMALAVMRCRRLPGSVCECSVIRWSDTVVTTCIACAAGKAAVIVIAVVQDRESTGMNLLAMLTILFNCVYSTLVPLFITRCACSQQLAVAARASLRFRSSYFVILVEFSVR